MKDIMTLTDDHGVDHEYELIDVLTYNEKMYCFFYPTEIDDTEILILRADDNEDPDKTTYNFEENQEIVDKVFEMFKEKHKDSFDFKC